MRGLAVIGDVLDINCWSNIPYFFYAAGEKEGFIQHPWQLDVSKFRLSRTLWNIGEILTLRGKGGYQFSEAFLNAAELQIRGEYFSEDIISLNQVFPRAQSVVERKGKITYYIDTTLRDYFNDPNYEVKIDARKKIAALKLENNNYQLAERIVTMSSWVKDSLIENYNISPDKVSVILPGANIPGDAMHARKAFSPGKGITEPFIFGFVGKDWKRKGLDITVKICETLELRGLKVKLKVIGNCPDKYKNHHLIEFTGFIDKQNETKKFVDEISQCDLGCLFSKGEALGISTLEFLNLGVPVTGFDHQGLHDTLFAGASLRFKLAQDPEAISAVIERYIRDESQQRANIEKALGYAYKTSWKRCVQEWEALTGSN